MKQLDLFEDKQVKQADTGIITDLNTDIGAVVESQKKYLLPTRGEDPTLTYGMLKRWIVDFHELNQMDLPSGFYRRTLNQLRGMFYGMSRTYGFSKDELDVRDYNF